jgi:hypothetical protein
MDWKRKFTSRKLWLAVAGLVTGIITLYRPGTDTTQITGLILSLGSVVAYIVGEGLVDAANAGATTVINGNVSANTDTTTPTGAAQVSAPAESAPTAENIAKAFAKVMQPAQTPTDVPVASDGKTDSVAQPESGAVASDTTGAK